VALFPFLAVLICTMGALIVLLVLLVQQARVDASSMVARTIGAPGGNDPKRREEELEDARWRRELLEQSRQEKTRELADARARLAHLEEHIQRLQAQAKERLEQARAIDEGKSLRSSDLEAARQELMRVTAEMERKKSELDKARKSKSGESWYALIPYVGPNGTRRRPIYIECTERGIVIQPEGIVLRPEDFAGSLGPGNPLDAALRTIREHIQEAGPAKEGEPYPLLVVRPSGVVAYAAARAALAAWDDEFGYELISDDKKLDFGAADPSLAPALTHSVEVARKRQAAMAAMMPRRSASGEALKSFAADDLPEVAEARSAVQGRGGGIATGASGAGNPTGRGGGLVGGNEIAAATAGGKTPHAGAASQSATAGVSQAKDSAGGSSPGTAVASGIQGMDAPKPGSQSQNLAFGSQQSRGPKSAEKNAAKGGSKSKVAGRGTNWGLPEARGRTTAVTRPIHVAVLADRLVIVPEKGDSRAPQQIRTAPDLSPEDVNRFVTAVQREIKDWGLAVADGYWKPVLQVEVAPDAERNFEELRASLEGSGFDMVRKSP
jgi:hypothetical protein